MSAVLPFLFKRYDSVSMELNMKGCELFWDDPRIEYLHLFEPRFFPESEATQKALEHWDECPKLYPDHEILNFFQAIEGKCVVYDWHPDSLLPADERRAKFCCNHYESHFEMAGIEMPAGWMHHETIFFDRDEEDKVLRWRGRDKGFFSLILALGGSSIQKVFPTWMEGFAKRLIDEFPRIKVYLVGDRECSGETWEYERTVNLVDTGIGFKQALHMTKYADYVLGSETGLLVGAGMFGTPKTTLFTLTDKNQIVNYHENDFSLQSKTACSPCFTLAYSGKQCPKEPVYNLFPLCTHEWDQDEILRLIETQYRKRF